MSSSTLPQSPAASNAMRQQLDELDAILQRMLTLPVNGRDEAEEKSRPESILTPPPVRRRPVLPPPLEKPPLPETVPSPPRVEPPAKQRGPAMILQQVSSPSTLSVPEMPPLKIADAPVSAPEASTSKAEQLPGSGQEQVETRQSPAGQDTSVAIEPIVVPKPSEFLDRRLKRLAEQRQAAPWIGPLSRLTAAFDRCFTALGRPGLWLVRSDVRAAMGWLGIGMLLAAAAILVGDWFGWTW